MGPFGPLGLRILPECCLVSTCKLQPPPGVFYCSVVLKADPNPVQSRVNPRSIRPGERIGEQIGRQRARQKGRQRGRQGGRPRQRGRQRGVKGNVKGDVKGDFGRAIYLTQPVFFTAKLFWCCCCACCRIPTIGNRNIGTSKGTSKGMSKERGRQKRCQRVVSNAAEWRRAVYLTQPVFFIAQLF